MSTSEFLRLFITLFLICFVEVYICYVGFGGIFNKRIFVLKGIRPILGKPAAQIGTGLFLLVLANNALFLYFWTGLPEAVVVLFAASIFLIILLLISVAFLAMKRMFEEAEVKKTNEQIESKTENTDPPANNAGSYREV